VPDDSLERQLVQLRTSLDWVKVEDSPRRWEYFAQNLQQLDQIISVLKQEKYRRAVCAHRDWVVARQCSECGEVRSQ
jgi:hypothetical protein